MLVCFFLRLFFPPPALTRSLTPPPIHSYNTERKRAASPHSAETIQSFLAKPENEHIFRLLRQKRAVGLNLALLECAPVKLSVQEEGSISAADLAMLWQLGAIKE